MDLKSAILLICYSVLIKATVLKHHIVIKSSETDETSGPNDWWKTAIFYQIYPRSYMDSNGDGIGDLQGIINRLDHLKDMGVTAAWLSPIYPSPGVDQGYDISDYEDIDPMFGNLTDLRNLIDQAHVLGIKIIMDFVPNHTSDQHKWFIESAKRNETYENYYIWKDGRDENTPPNNWISIFGGPAWTYHKERKQFYYHQFASAQPDLNYRSKEVVNDMKTVLRYWLNFGVDGFRMDAVPYLFEEESLPDEPLSGAAGLTDKDYRYLKHPYTSNLDETYDMIYQFRAVVDEYNNDTSTPARIMMTEASTDTAEQAVLYYGNDTVDGAHFTFNFNLLGLSSEFTVDNTITEVNMWLSHLPKRYVSNWVLGNHDNHRVATRIGVENVDAFNMLTAFLPGIQITYMGEEIGMEDGEVTCEQGWDPQAIKNCDTFNKTSRDFERTPYQWDDSPNAGFSTNSSTWLPVSKKYNITNLKAEINNSSSHYNVYKRMVQLREDFSNISEDAVSLIKLSETVLEVVRRTSNGDYIYLFKTGESKEEVSVYTSQSTAKILVTGVNSQFKVGDKLPNPVTLLPHESLIAVEGGQSVSSAVSLKPAALLASCIKYVCLNYLFN